MSDNPMRWQNEEPMHGVFLNPGEADGLTLLDMPAGLKPRLVPVLAAGVEISDRIRNFAHAIQSKLMAMTPGADCAVLDTVGLSDADRVVLSDLLGEGEVSIVAGHDGVTQIVESTLIGIWRVLREENGNVVSDTVEIGAIPRIVRQINLAGAAQPAPLPDPLPEGLMNGPPVIAEIAAKAREWKPGEENAVINFTLMPVSPADASLIAHCLGQAPLLVLSRGYGACRVVSSAVRHVWAVQYLNSTGKIILDTIEIGDVPSVALAAAEDFADSTRRLSEIIAAYLG